jgi:hypothetical protein
VGYFKNLELARMDREERESALRPRTWHCVREFRGEWTVAFWTGDGRWLDLDGTVPVYEIGAEIDPAALMRAVKDQERVG